MRSKNSNFRLNINQALYIENELNKVLFDNVPVGALFSELIYNSFYFIESEPSLKYAVKNKIYSLYLKKIKINNKVKPNQTLQGKLILSYVSNTSRFTDFFKPLLAQVASDKIVFCSNPTEQNSEWNQYPFFTFNGITDEEYKQWYKNYRNLKVDFQKAIKIICDTIGANVQFKSTFELILVIQTQRLQHFINCFGHEKPIGILADHDKHALNSSLILAANKWGIPTYTLVHGSTKPIDFYVPIVAKKVFCWGEVQKNQFIDAGTENSKIIVTGNQKLNREYPFDKNQIRFKYGILNNRKNITILSNPIDSYQKINFVSDILKTCYYNFNVLLRIHPSEEKKDYEQIRYEYPNLICLDNTNQTLEETLACSDLVICHNSTAGFEAITKNIPLIIFNPAYISFPLGIGEELNEKADVPLFKSTEELRMYLQSKDCFEAGFNFKKEEYIKSYIHAFGDEAAKIIVNELLMKKGVKGL
jgi:hypothetical protein